jgi:hypothetical protein
MGYQFRGQQRAQNRPIPTTPTPPLFDLGRRRTDPLKLEDMYKRLNVPLEDTGKMRALAGYPRTTTYKIGAKLNVLAWMFGAADDHVNRRMDRKKPKKMILGQIPGQAFKDLMASYGLSLDDGFTYIRQGDDNPTCIPVELDVTIDPNMIICVH